MWYSQQYSQLPANFQATSLNVCSPKFFDLTPYRHIAMPSNSLQMRSYARQANGARQNKHAEK
jgi:hypothetical protein